MRWSASRLFGILGLLAASSWAQADQDYGVLIISRERLEVPTSCEIGIYIQDELAARLFQEQSTSFNLPPGDISVRLRLLPGQAPGCGQGLEAQQRSVVHLKAGDIQKFRIAQNLNGMYLKPSSLGY